MHVCRLSGDSPTHPDSYDIDLEVPAPTMEATAPLLQHLNTSREVEQVRFCCSWLNCSFISN